MTRTANSYAVYQILSADGSHLWRLKAKNEASAINRFRRDCLTHKDHPEVFAVLHDNVQHSMDKESKVQ